MQARARVREFLAGEKTDRPPFLPFVTDFSARLEQVSRLEMFADPNVLARTLFGAQRLFGHDAILVSLHARLAAETIRAEAGPTAGSLRGVAVIAEAIHRLRAVAGEHAALVLVVPGPLTIARELGARGDAGDLDRLAQDVLELVNTLRPEQLDSLAVLETEPLDDQILQELSEALSALWNLAHYYALPGVLFAAHAGRDAAIIEPDAVAVWAGATPEELLAAGARRVGVPVAPGQRGPLPPLPGGGFYTTAGELPGDVDVESFETLVRHATNPISA